MISVTPIRVSSGSLNKMAAITLVPVPCCLWIGLEPSFPQTVILKTKMAGKERRVSRGMTAKSFVCDFPDCNQSFNKNWRLVEHKRSHTGEVSLLYLFVTKIYIYLSPDSLSHTVTLRVRHCRHSYKLAQKFEDMCNISKFLKDIFCTEEPCNLDF